ncbi:hypothetical protein YPPY32_3078, partial [Yersinia pestis PY-32]
MVTCEEKEARRVPT